MVNYKSSHLVCDSLTSLLPQLDPQLDSVTVVDNDSQDDSVELISSFVEQQAMTEMVTVISSAHNGGFSYGNNLAIRPALKTQGSVPEFVLLLNPDTVVLEGAVEALLAFMEQHPNAGIAGSRLQSDDGVIQCSSFRFHTIASEFESAIRLGFISQLLAKYRVPTDIVEKAVETDWVAGASMMIRSGVIRDVGLMDEGYFLYFEETDLCLQAKRHEWECWYVPDSRVVHFVGQSTGVVSGNVERTRRPKYWFEARQRYFVKNHGFVYGLIADFAWITGFSFWRIRRFIQNKPDTDPAQMLCDFVKHSVFLSWLNKERG